MRQYQKIVVKIGTSSLTYANGKLNLNTIEQLARVLTDLKNQGKDVILVSSGAIGVGASRLGMKEKPSETKQKQASAAVGQAILMQIYQKLFMEYNQIVAQILLTKDNIEEGVKKQNTINTFDTLLKMGVIPIVNENDTISTYEIEFTDNDRLSAHVALLLEADLLILLTDIDGLYDKDPRKDQKAKKIHRVTEVTQKVADMGGDAGSTFGTGGMASKISAASMVMPYGMDAVVADGSDPHIIYEIIENKDVGTLFCGKTGDRI